MRVVVYCGSSDVVPSGHLALGEVVGRELAAAGHEVVFGGGRVGLMGSLARGVRAGGGRITGVILDRFLDMGVGDPEVEEMVVTPTMRQRKEGLELRSDAHLVLPGGVGTMDEFFEILSLQYIGINRNPMIMLNHDGFFDHIIAFLGEITAQGYYREERGGLLQTATSPAEVVAILATLCCP